jgi:hypothetical protein
MTSKKKNYLALAINRIDLMRSVKCDLSKLPRILSPYFKTTLLNDKVIFLKLKNSKIGVSITKMEPFARTQFYRVYSTNFPFYSFDISALTNKELLTKIILKYELFN